MKGCGELAEAERLEALVKTGLSRTVEVRY